MKRAPGLSAMLRVKNEEEFLPYCLESINPWFDEIVIIDQNSTDRTIEVIEQFGDGSKTIVYRYPYECRPNGPGFEQQSYDQHNRAFFYNWCLQKTTRRWVCKWDGDMVAMDGLDRLIHKIIQSEFAGAINIPGIDIVNWDIDDQFWVGKREIIKEKEPRFFQVVDGKTYWVNGFASEKLICGSVCAEVTTPVYLHFKWCKPIEKATQSWPVNWEKEKHFNDIFERRKAVQEYAGSIPSCLIQTT